ncbi:Gldg family protein [uncultured Butyricimonas sp.]|uniref:Gldg family protein n=1 Tax=uncultured Butyricimonas sp. TaxID=1268785 RepID=UPI0026DC44A6|nr:Gldg family protein [uncultured Butyricimonas sp.]
MRTIYKIARTELRTLFYSPVAWFILIIFTFQVSMDFSDSFGYLVRMKMMGYQNGNLTYRIFSTTGGLFSVVQSYLYLYLPLLTMGLMSRELGSGSINLLYSSPVTNRQIILGKFLSMMFYGLLLILILMVFIIFVAFSINDVDFPLILSGLLGVYLLICAYAAIGLFMSSQTSYQVVAAMGTLAILAFLNFVGRMWQDIEFVRDITYWLSINGRASNFIGGLICSEDVLYFVIIVALFLFLTIIRLQSRRQRSSAMATWGKYAGVCAIAVLLGYFSALPRFMTYYDATRTKMNTLTRNSQNIVAKMKGGLTITTYVNLFDHYAGIALPASVKGDLQQFRQYTRFKPEIKMKYVYYYDTVANSDLNLRFPDMTMEEQAKKLAEIQNVNIKLFLTPERIRQKIDLSPEGNRFVRLLERENGEKTFLRIYNDMLVMPQEPEISAALKRLVMTLPKVGFLVGHGERDSKKDGERDYSQFARQKTFRYALINQGFDVTDVTLNNSIPEDVNIMVIADMKTPLSAVEMENLDEYVSRGGNLMIAGEPKRQEVMSPVVERFGVRFAEGCLVRPTENFQSDLICSRATLKAAKMSYPFETMYRFGQVVAMPGCVGLEYETDRGYTVDRWFETDSLAWNELETKNFVEDTVRLNVKIGEVQKSYATGLALTRKVGEKDQKIIILGDANCISNGEFGHRRNGVPAANYTVITGGFYWLSDGEVPVDVRRPPVPDNDIYLDQDDMDTAKIVFMGVLPGLLLLLALFIWIRRRGK